MPLTTPLLFVVICQAKRMHKHWLTHHLMITQHCGLCQADQAASANRADATIQAERSGMLDLSGDEIPTTATTANTLQLRVGTVLKIMAANEYRVLSSPLYNTDVTDNSAVEIQQNGVQVVAAATVINFVRKWRDGD